MILIIKMFSFIIIMLDILNIFNLNNNLWKIYLFKFIKIDFGKKKFFLKKKTNK